MSTFLYSGPSGDQYEAWKKEYLEKQEAAEQVEPASKEKVVEGPADAEVPTEDTPTPKRGASKK